jgi:hypothetical protein
MPEPDLEALLRWASSYVTDDQLIKMARLDYEPIENRVEQVLPGLQRIRDAKSLFHLMRHHPGLHWDCAFQMYTYWVSDMNSIAELAGALFAGGFHFIQNTFDSDLYTIEANFLANMTQYLCAVKQRDAAVAGAQTFLASCEWSQANEVILDRLPASYTLLLVYHTIKPFLSQSELDDCRECLLDRIHFDRAEYIKNIELNTISASKRFRKKINPASMSDHEMFLHWARTDLSLQGSIAIELYIDDLYESVAP